MFLSLQVSIFLKGLGGSILCWDVPRLAYVLEPPRAYLFEMFVRVCPLLGCA
jgi:hypothetical protein